MEEQLMSFETAKLAREKGFDVRTSELWVEGKCGEISTISDWEISKGKWDEDWYKSLGFYAATQSLLQKWLWEKHSMWVEINIYANGFSYRISDRYGKTIKMEPEDPFDSPYDALEEGLRETLIKL